MHHWVYGLGSGDDLDPSLFRLPAYPIVLAVFHQLFGNLPHGGWFVALYLFQSVVDIIGCLLLAAFAYRYISPRAGEIALALAMLCPFTAAEAGTAMTECLSIFAVSLGIYAAGRILSADAAGQNDTPAVILAGCASALAMLLRPDGALLSVALAAGLFFYILRDRDVLGMGLALRRSLTTTSIYCLVALAPIAVWTLRNWVTFQVFQPLAPRYLGDPGDRPNVGVYRWIRTWAVEYVSTADVFWQVGAGTIDPDDLPTRAFDSPAERAQTLALLDEYNHTISVSVDLDHRFGALAAERIHAHPLRYYLWLPAAAHRRHAVSVPARMSSNSKSSGGAGANIPTKLHAPSCRPRQSFLCRCGGLGIPPPSRALALDARRLHPPALSAAWHHGELRAALLAGVFSHLHRRCRRGPKRFQICDVADACCPTPTGCPILKLNAPQRALGVGGIADSANSANSLSPAVSPLCATIHFRLILPCELLDFFPRLSADWL